MHPGILLLAERFVTAMERMSEDVKNISTYMYDLNCSVSYLLKDKREKEERENCPSCPPTAGQKVSAEIQYSRQREQAGNDVDHERSSVGGDWNENSEGSSPVSTGQTHFVVKEEEIEIEEASCIGIKEEPVSLLSSHSSCNESVDNEIMDGYWQVTSNGKKITVNEEAIDGEEIPLNRIKDELTSVSSNIIVCDDLVQNETRNVNLVGEQTSTIELTRYSENLVSETHKAINAEELNSHAVLHNSGDTTEADKGLSMQCLIHMGKFHEGNLRKSTASSSSCIEKEVRGEYGKQDVNHLEMCRRKPSSSQESSFRTQVNEKSSNEETQSSSSKGISSKQSKRKKETRKLFHCNICGKCFHSNHSLENHERIHTGNKPFQCALCNKTWTTKSNLVIHMKVHSEEKPYRCSFCVKTFKRNYELKIHMRNHSGYKPFDCSVCGKAFAQSSQLTSHIRVHTSEKPYTCTECGSAFSQSSHLTIHKRVHTGERPFVCSDCGWRFITSSNLRSHRARVHVAACPASPHTA